MWDDRKRKEGNEREKGKRNGRRNEGRRVKNIDRKIEEIKREGEI